MTGCMNDSNTAMIRVGTKGLPTFKNGEDGAVLNYI